MADRGLAHWRGIRHVADPGGDAVVRINLVNVPLEGGKGHQNATGAEAPVAFWWWRAAITTGAR
jgi:hypothetical protein